ncbi:MAG TPA: NYN domain-containing protein [Candidatus Hydrogenedentes bacterium]|nr:NYN domain-containing protein [Candidatus Hydrogenedentota bacterium]
MPTAFLIDGDFFLKRHQRLRGNSFPKQVARDLQWMCRQHLEKLNRTSGDLYRIFFYDCPPLEKKVHNPVTNRALDFSKTATAIWRRDFHAELKKTRKVALRLGYLNDRSGAWVLKGDNLKKLLKGDIAVQDLKEDDVRYDVKQKGVDMRIGLDIASLAFKRQVDQIVLVAGDSDFVPAAKLARREGIDFILDPMWAPIRHDLHEHIDGLQSVFRQGNVDQPQPQDEGGKMIETMTDPAEEA